MSNSTPGRGSDQFPLRFPDGMRDELKKRAASNGRSLNAEIISRLSKSIASEDMHYRMKRRKPWDGISPDHLDDDAMPLPDDAIDQLKKIDQMLDEIQDIKEFIAKTQRDLKE